MTKLSEPYKVNIIEESKQENNFQIYHQQNTDFYDLCRGPHLPNLKHIGVFKLTKLAGAYWRGDAKMRCFNAYMEQRGGMRKSSKII